MRTIVNPARFIVFDVTVDLLRGAVDRMIAGSHELLSGGRAIRGLLDHVERP